MDSSLFRWINRLALHTSWAHSFFIAYAKYGVVLFALMLLGSYLDGRHRNELSIVAGSVWAGGAALVALGIGQLIGGAIDRARPYEAMVGVQVLVDKTTDFSFPSDHATTAGAVAAGLFLANRRWGIVAVGLALLMAFTRVYVGAHYPSDVIAGLALGAAVAAAGHKLLVPTLARVAKRLTQTPLKPLLVADRT
jgi:membrane-associated phospholipid phosphatase